MPNDDITIIDSICSNIAGLTIDSVTETVLDLPQADLPVAHHFGPQLYIRQLTMPAGTFVIGHKQRFWQQNIMLCGKIAMVDDKGHSNIVEAPLIFVGPPGQKMGYVIETAVWLNVYVNHDDERDIDILENRYLDKEGPWTAREAIERPRRKEARQEDRNDFALMCEEIGVPAEVIRAQSEDCNDLIPMPDGFSSVITLRESDIEGRGLFASWPFNAGDLIGPALIDGRRTPLGRYTNHAKDPNCEFVIAHNGDIIAVAKRYISGCRGGDKGEELTVDYRQVYKLTRGEECQER